MSTKGSEQRRYETQERTAQEEDGREGVLKLLLGRICCVVGLLSGIGGIVFAVLGASVNVSAGAVGIVLGLVGYFLGVRWLGVAAVVLGVITIFFMAAASTGLIPGVAPPGHGYN